MVRDILTYPNEELKKVSEPVTEFDDELKQLVNDMFETMYVKGGVGLAAPQIGVHKQIIVIDLSPAMEPDATEKEVEKKAVEKLVVINPQLIGHSKSKTEFSEGCLSIPGRFETVTRWAGIRLKCQNERGEEMEYDFVGLPAIVVQHEIDHLLGKLMLDRLSFLKRLSIKAGEVLQ